MINWNTNRLQRRGDFFIKIFLTSILCLVGAWALLQFVITTQAVDLKKAEYDNTTKYLMGKIVRIGYFPRANLPGFEIKTRMGNVWIITSKDMPAKGVTVFMEATVYNTGKTFWHRFAHDKDRNNKERMSAMQRSKVVHCVVGDHRPGHQPKKANTEKVSLPVCYEMVRLQMPF